jgi:prevent-host-death family protein
VLVELLGGDPSAACDHTARIEAILAVSDIGLPQMHHRDGVASWAVNKRALARGHDIRTGIEDTGQLSDGADAADNEALVVVALYCPVHSCTMLSMTDSITVSQARASLPGLLDRVQAGEEIVLTRHGHPVAVLVRPDSLRVRRADSRLAAAERVRALLNEVGSQDLDEVLSLKESRAEELIRQVRESRKRR